MSAGEWRRWQLGGVLARDHLLFFALATAGLFLITPFYVAHALRAAGVVWPALSALSLPPAQVPYTSPALAAFLIAFLTTFSLSWSARRAVLIVSSVPIGLTLGGHLDPLGVGLFAAFVLLAYAAVTLPRQVWMAVALSCGLSFGFMCVGLRWAPLYHVLLGTLDPLHGVGPDELTVAGLLARVAAGGVREVILATNPTVEGEATAHYLVRALRPAGATLTRIAFGLPAGGEISYADQVTLTRALTGRRGIA